MDCLERKIYSFTIYNVFEYGRNFFLCHLSVKLVRFFERLLPDPYSMTDLRQIEILKLHAIFLDRNKDLVWAIRDKKPRNVIAAIYQELKQIYLAISEQEKFLRMSMEN